MKRLILIILLFCLKYSQVSAQCCGAGNPVTTVNGESTVSKGRYRVALNYRHSVSDSYYEGSHVSSFDFPGRLRQASYDFTSLNLGYGITSRLSVQAQLGYFIGKNEDYITDLFPDVHASGVGDLGITIHYTVLRKLIENVEVTPFFGVKIPVGKFDCESSGVKLPISMQPSSGSFKYTAGAYASLSPHAILSLYTYDYYEHAQRIRSKMFDYQYGPLVYTSIGCTFRILPKFDIGLQTNYEHKGQAKEQGLRLEGTTYNTLKISPQIYFRPYNGWQFYINADVPVWHKTVGLQMVNSWALQTGIQYYL